MSCITLVWNGNIASMDRSQARGISEVRHEYRISSRRPEVRLNWRLETDALGGKRLRMQWLPKQTR